MHSLLNIRQLVSFLALTAYLTGCGPKPEESSIQSFTSAETKRCGDFDKDQYNHILSDKEVWEFSFFFQDFETTNQKVRDCEVGFETEITAGHRYRIGTGEAYGAYTLDEDSAAVTSQYGQQKATKEITEEGDLSIFTDKAEYSSCLSETKSISSSSLFAINQRGDKEADYFMLDEIILNVEIEACNEEN